MGAATAAHGEGDSVGSCAATHRAVPIPSVGIISSNVRRMTVSSDAPMPRRELGVPTGAGI